MASVQPSSEGGSESVERAQSRDDLSNEVHALLRFIYLPECITLKDVQDKVRELGGNVKNLPDPDAAYWANIEVLRDLLAPKEQNAGDS